MSCTGPRYLITHLRCNNDRNGNPRRIYAVADLAAAAEMDGAAHPAARMLYFDEEYAGEDAIPPAIRKDAAWGGVHYITPGEYRDCLTLARMKHTA